MNIPTSQPSGIEVSKETVDRESVSVGSSVRHKKFGKGTVSKMDCKESYIFVKFILGEKKFIFPKAFEAGFLEVE